MARNLLVPLAALVAALTLSAPARGAQAPEPCPGPSSAGTSVPRLLDLATYRVHTTYRRPTGGEVERTVPAVVGVPTPVDATGDLLRLPDVVVTLLPTSASSAQLLVVRSNVAPLKLPVRVEAVVDANDALDAGFGYDARDTNAPLSVTTTFAFSFGKPLPNGHQGTATDLRLDVLTIGPAEGLKLVGDLRDTTVARDETAAAIGFSPVPASLGAHATITCDGFVKTTHVTATASSPSRVDATVRDVEADDTTAASAVVDRLPRQVDVDVVDDRQARRQTVTTSSDAAIDHLDLTSDTLDTADVLQREVRARADGVPADGVEVTLAKHDGDETRLTARTRGATPLGVVEGGSADGRKVSFVDDPRTLFKPSDGLADGVVPGYAFVPREGSVAVRVAGLQQATIDTDDPASDEDHTLRVEASSKAQPFGVRQFSGTRTVTGRILDLPDDVKLTIAKDPAVFRYTGSAPIAHAHIDATDPLGLIRRPSGPRPTAGHVDVDGVPRCMELKVLDGGLQLHAGVGVGGPILGVCRGAVGHIQALVGTAPFGSPDPLLPEADDAIAGDEDGASITDRPDRFTLAAAVTDVRTLEFQQSETHGHLDAGQLSDHPAYAFDQEDKVLQATLRHGADTGPPFAIHVERGDDLEYLDTRLAATPQRLDLTVDSRTFTALGVAHAPGCDTGDLAARTCETTTDVTWDASGDLVSPPSQAQRQALVLDSDMGERDRPLPRVGEFTGDRPNLHVEVPELPSHLEFCQSSMRNCGFSSGRVPLGGQLRVDASRQFHVLFFDCRHAGLDNKCEHAEFKADRQVSTFADIERLQDVKFDSTIPQIRGGEKGHLYLDTRDDDGVMHPVDGDGLDLFQSSISTDPCNDGDVSQLAGEFRDVTAADKLMDFEIVNVRCQPTEIEESGGPHGFIHCGEEFRLDGNPQGAFGSLDNDFCTSDNRG